MRVKLQMADNELLLLKIGIHFVFSNERNTRININKSKYEERLKEEKKLGKGLRREVPMAYEETAYNKLK